MSARPEFVTDAHLDYLDALRNYGVINMFGARPLLLRTFPLLTSPQGSDVLSYWMKTFPRSEA